MHHRPAHDAGEEKSIGAGHECLLWFRLGRARERDLTGCEASKLREIPLRLDEPGLELQRLLKLTDGFGDLALRRKRDAEVVVGFGRVRHQLKSHLKLIGRFLEHFALQQGAAQIIAGRAVTRIEMDRAAQMLDGLLLHPPGHQGIAHVPMRAGRGGVEAQGFTKLRDRLIELTRSGESNAQVVVHIR